MTLKSLPVRSFESVLHVGTLDPERRSRWSLEGRWLSASRCPNAWASIARLGVAPAWELSNPDGRPLVFLDGLAIVGAGLDAVRAWAVANQWCERVSACRAWHFDSEQDVWTYSLHATRDEAVAEVADPNETRDDGSSVVEPAVCYRSTPRLDGWFGRSQGELDCDDALICCWLELGPGRKLAVAGVYWAEAYAPEALSAPRMAIRPTVLPSLAKGMVRYEDLPDDDELLEGGRVLPLAVQDREAA